jgi:hypothetical protein
MASTLLLEQTLAQTVSWNKARINFLAKFIVALLQVKTVSLVQIASVMSGCAKAESHYKRCQRFLRFFELEFAEVAALVLKLLGVPSPFVISLDRTDWYLGQTPLNILMLSVVYEGLAFPLLWVVLEKKGCCDTTERIALLEQYQRLFGKDSLEFVTADREFIGTTWFAYLCKEKIPLRIRIRENLLVTTANGRKRVAARKLFGTQKAEVGVLLNGRRRVLGQDLFLMGMRKASGDYVIVASDEASPSVLDDYAKRWKIETLFGCLKSRGFCLEATHVTDKERLEKLLALLTIAFCWAFLAGQWLTRRCPLKVKSHGRLSKSVFRCGFDHLRHIVCNLSDRRQKIAWYQVIQLLSCT